MQQVPTIEKALLLRIAEGDEAAFRQLYDTWKDRVYGYVLTVTRSTITAEDAVQDIFLKLWLMGERLSSIENLDAYLRRMARNHAYSGFRRGALEALVRDRISKLDSDATIAGTDDPLLAKEVQRVITNLVDRLTPSQRKVFLLSREQGLSHEEIATLLNMSRNTVKQHMTAALRFLRQELHARYGNGAMAIFVVFSL